MANRQSKSREQDQPGATPQPSFEPGPAAPEDTNLEHPGVTGQRETVPGAGIVSAGAQAGPVQSGPPEARQQPYPGKPSPGAPGLAPQAASSPGDPPLSVPTGSAGAPEPAGAGVPGIADPNFSAAHRHTHQEQIAGNAGFAPGDAAPRRNPRRVQDIMTANVECCTPRTELQYVAKMMADRDCGAIPVVENTDTMKPVGIITDRDIALRVVAKGQNPYDLRIADCMSSGLVTVTPDTSIHDCVQLMEDRQVRRVVVVDAAGRCIGIVAQADIAHYAPFQETAELVQEVSRPSEFHGAYH